MATWAGTRRSTYPPVRRQLPPHQEAYGVHISLLPRATRSPCAWEVCHVRQVCVCVVVCVSCRMRQSCRHSCVQPQCWTTRVGSHCLFVRCELPRCALRSSPRPILSLSHHMRVGPGRPDQGRSLGGPGPHGPGLSKGNPTARGLPTPPLAVGAALFLFVPRP